MTDLNVTLRQEIEQLRKENERYKTILSTPWDNSDDGWTAYGNWETWIRKKMLTDAAKEEWTEISTVISCSIRDVVHSLFLKINQLREELEYYKSGEPERQPNMPHEERIRIRKILEEK